MCIRDRAFARYQCKNIYSRLKIMVEFRPNARPGLWVIFLIPMALLASYTSNNVLPQTHVIIIILSLVMSVYCTILAHELFSSKKSLFLDIVNEDVSLQKSNLKRLTSIYIPFYLLFCGGVIFLYIIGSCVFVFSFTIGKI